MHIVTAATALVFLTLAVVHLYWALGGRIGWVVAIPERNGRPMFTPSRAATLAVSVALFLCASLIAATGDLWTAPVSSIVLKWLTIGLALVLILRAIGDFHLVGFFKRVRGSRFARLDTALYSPACVLLAISALAVAVSSDA
jgi:hypothetical protein